MAIETIWSETLDTSDSGWANYTVRNVIAAADITKSANRIRVTLQAAGSGNLVIDNASIVERDPGTDDGTEVPTELLWSGSSGVTVLAGSESTSDWLDFTINSSKDYLVILDFAATANWAKKLSSGGGGRYYKAASNSYNVQSITGSTWNAGVTTAVCKIEGDIGGGRVIPIFW